MQLRVCLRSLAPEASGKMRSEPDQPSPNSFMGDRDVALGQYLIDIAEAEIEPSVRPDGTRDDRRRAVAISIADRVDLVSSSGSPQLMHPSL